MQIMSLVGQITQGHTDRIEIIRMWRRYQQVQLAWPSDASEVNRTNTIQQKIQIHITSQIKKPLSKEKHLQNTNCFILFINKQYISTISILSYLFRKLHYLHVKSI